MDTKVGVDASPAEKAVVTRSRGASVQTIYDALKRDILEMAIAPGEPLDEVRLSERFAMSRTPGAFRRSDDELPQLHVS